MVRPDRVLDEIFESNRHQEHKAVSITFKDRQKTKLAMALPLLDLERT